MILRALYRMYDSICVFEVKNRLIAVKRKELPNV